MTRSKYPILRTGDDATLDWPDATYRASVTFIGNDVRVSQEIAGANHLDQRIQDGSARWVVELRSPSTLYAEVCDLDGAVATIPLKTKELGDVVYAIPGVVCETAFEIEPEALSPVWAGAAVAVAPGAWLARGPIHSNRNRVQSLIAFDLNEALAPGTMQITDPYGDDDVRFTVLLAPDLYSQTADRAVRHAALVGVFARLPRVAARNPEAGTGAHRQLAAIRNRLAEHGVASWDAEADYDAARAATCFEPISALPQIEETQ